MTYDVPPPTEHQKARARARHVEGRCGTCAFWRRHHHAGQWGVCRRITGDSDVAVIPTGESDVYVNGFETHQSLFGCVLWEKMEGE